MRLDQLPADIIHHLAYYLPPTDNLRCQRVSSRLRDSCAESVLWRHYCRTRFRYWASASSFWSLLRQPIHQVPGYAWQNLYLERKRINRGAARVFDRIVQTKVGRYQNYHYLCQLEYDVKDFLLSQSCITPSHPEALARSYYARSVLDCIHRRIAIKEWHALAELDRVSATGPTHYPVERALGALDLFVLHDRFGDLDEVSQIFDAIAAEFVAVQQSTAGTSPRQLALALVAWLRSRNLVGLRHDWTALHLVRYNFIGQSLCRQDHGSNATVSNVIYCAVARRLGLAATCVQRGLTTLVLVQAPPTATLDDVQPDKVHGHADDDISRKTVVNKKNGNKDPNRMYIDAFWSDTEITPVEFEENLTRLQYERPYDRYMTTAPICHVVLAASERLGQSLWAIRAVRSEEGDLMSLLSGDVALNRGLCHYARSWSRIMSQVANDHELVQHISLLVQQFMRESYPEDAWLAQEFLTPFIDHVSSLPHFATFGAGVRSILKDIQTLDLASPEVYRRGESRLEVPFKIGQMIRHLRYDWVGVVVGWRGPLQRPGCVSSALTSDDLPLPAERMRLFLQCIQSGDPRECVVSANSTRLFTDASLVNLSDYPTAGKYFKRFDEDTCSFVSNMEEIYPDG